MTGPSAEKQPPIDETVPARIIADADATLVESSFGEPPNGEVVVVCRKSIFRVSDHVGIERQHREAVIEGIASVWEKLVGEPGEHQVIIASRVSTRKRENVVALYDPDDDLFCFSSIRVPGMLGEQAAEGATWLMAGAHEAAHKVQFFRGESPAPSGMDAKHDDSEHEVEAWRVALDLLKRDYPQARGTMPVGSVTLAVPEASTFCR